MRQLITLQYQSIQAWLIAALHQLGLQAVNQSALTQKANSYPDLEQSFLLGKLLCSLRLLLDLFTYVVMVYKVSLCSYLLNWVKLSVLLTFRGQRSIAPRMAKAAKFY